MQRRRVLIVTSSYAPVMVADMQRARMLARELPSFGWDVEILCPDESFHLPETIEDDPAPFFEASTPVHRVRPVASAFFDRLGMRSIGWRAFWPMLRAGSALLAARRFDLVYMSTTQFNLFLLARWWRFRRGVPYALDFHDPCYNPRPGFAGGTPPGLKRGLNSWLHRWIEALSVRSANGIVSVSPNYLSSMRERYGARECAWLPPARHAVIPFAGSLRDLESAGPGAGQGTGGPRMVYVGAGGPVMERSFHVLCEALAALRQHDRRLVDGLRVELYGTTLRWRVGDPCHLAAIAARHGVGDLVVEDPRRVSYRRSLQLLKGGDAALVLGVDVDHYMPSKLFTYALSQLPLLGVMRSGSPGAHSFEEFAGRGHLVAFDSKSPEPAAAARVLASVLQEARAGLRFARSDVETAHGSRSMAAAHARLFDACVGNSDSPAGAAP